MERILRLVLLSLLVACSRTSSTDSDAGATSDASKVAPVTVVDASAPLEDRAYVAVTPGEAKRSLVKELKDERAKKHFTADGGALPPLLEMQTADLAIQGRRAVLVAEANKPATTARPFAYVTEADGTLVWSKDWPHAGIMQPVGQLAIGAAPKGRVALIACDPPTTSVALRIWDHDGFPFADFQAMKVDACDELALLSWPKRGYIVVASRSGATTAQLLDEDGRVQWGSGVDLGTRPKTALPVGMAADNIGKKREEDSFLLVQGGATADGALHAYAFRYDLRGIALWQAALDLGPIPNGSRERPILKRVSDGLVHATLPGGKLVEIKSSGESTALGQAPK